MCEGKGFTGKILQHHTLAYSDNCVCFKSALPNAPMKQIHRHSELALGHLGTIKVLLGVSSNTASIKGKETVEK